MLVLELELWVYVVVGGGERGVCLEICPARPGPGSGTEPLTASGRGE